MSFRAALHDLDSTYSNWIYDDRRIFDAVKDSAILNTLNEWIGSAQVTVSWGKRWVTLPQYTDPQELHEIIARSLHLFRKEYMPPAFRLKCYETAKKLAVYVHLRDRCDEIKEHFICCLRCLGATTAMNRERTLLHYAGPAEARNVYRISPLFKYSPKEFETFFPGQKPVESYPDSEPTDSLGGEEWFDIYVASLEQMQKNAGLSDTK